MRLRLPASGHSTAMLQKVNASIFQAEEAFIPLRQNLDSQLVHGTPPRAPGFPEELLQRINTPSTLHSLASMKSEKVLLANKQLEEVAPMLNNTIALPRSSHDRFCRVAPPRITSLKSIQLSQLELDSCHQGSALHGFLRGKTFKLDRLAVAAVEDTSGMVARLVLQNIVETETCAQELEFRYPDGAQVVLNEPCLVKEILEMKGVCLWVPNPACFKVVSRFPGLVVEEASGFMELGDRELSIGNLLGAVELYTNCINGSEEKSALQKLALAKRSDAYLKLGYKFQALEDAERANSLVSKARALSALGSYRAAAESFREAHVLSKSDTKLKTDCVESQRLYEQSLKGNTSIAGISSVALSTCASRGSEEETPRFPDYVGPIEVRMTTDGKGRGLFTTADVTKGELLLVQNAVVPNGNDDGKGRCTRRGDFFTRVISACLACPRTYAQVKAMIEEESVPGMELFEPNWDISEQLQLLKLRADTSAFDVTGMEWLVARAVSIRHGIWALPAFINHSCLPNVTTGGVGKAQYVYAARDMKSGTELLSSYWDVLKPWNSLRRSRPNNFACGCARCSLEKRLEEPLEDVCRRLESGLERLGDEESCGLNSFSVDEELARLAVDVEKLLIKLELSEEEKSWLRTSFSEAYLHYYRVECELPIMPQVESFMEDLLATAPGKVLELMMKCICTTSHSFDKSRATQQEAFLRYGEAGRRLFGKNIPD